MLLEDARNVVCDSVILSVLLCFNGDRAKMKGQPCWLMMAMEQTWNRYRRLNQSRDVHFVNLFQVKCHFHVETHPWQPVMAAGRTVLSRDSHGEEVDHRKRLESRVHLLLQREARAPKRARNTGGREGKTEAGKSTGRVGNTWRSQVLSTLFNNVGTWVISF